MESTEAKALRSAVRIVEAPESQSITHVTRTGPLDLRRDALAVSYLNNRVKLNVTISLPLGGCERTDS